MLPDNRSTFFSQLNLTFIPGKQRYDVMSFSGPPPETKTAYRTARFSKPITENATLVVLGLEERAGKKLRLCPTCLQAVDIVSKLVWQIIQA